MTKNNSKICIICFKRLKKPCLSIFLIALFLIYPLMVKGQKPLTISNIKVITTDKTATISWQTNFPADGLVEFGKTSDYSNNLRSGEPNSNDHAITLYGLLPETLYHFRIKSAGNNQEVVSFDQTFKTNQEVDFKSPKISNVQVVYLTGTSATIRWETDEPADSQIYYGQTADYGSAVVDGRLTLIHDLTIRNLQTGTFYHFLVKSKDKHNNITVYYDLTFKTLITEAAEKEDLIIYAIEPTAENNLNVTKNTAAISWHTNKLSRGWVKYGNNENSLFQTIATSPPRAFFHSLTLINLQAATTYYFQIEVEDVFGKRKKSEIASFITKGIPDYQSSQNNNSLNINIGNEIVNFNGQNDYLEIPFQNDFNQLPLSFTIWAKPQNNNNNYQAIFSRETTAGHPWLLRLMINQGNGFIYADIAAENDARLNVFTNISLFDNQWHFLTVTLDNNYLKVYLDGELKGERNTTNFSIPLKSQQPIWLGASKFRNLSYPFLGSMSSFRYYNYILTSEQIKELYQKDIFALSPQASPNFQILGVSTLDYTQAQALYKTSTNPDIFAILAGQKHFLSSPSSFEAYGYRWQDVKIISQENLDKYPDVRLVKIPNNNTVYYLYKRPQKQWLKIAIPSPTVFVSYPENYWGNIVVINEKDLNSYPDVKLIKIKNNSTVYLLENNVKQPIKNAEIFEKMGFRWSEIVEINETHLNNYSTGEMIEN